MLTKFKEKVEKIAEDYADLISDKIKQESTVWNTVSGLNEINEGIRTLNHITCTIERINRIQKGVECGLDEDVNENS